MIRLLFWLEVIALPFQVMAQDAGPPDAKADEQLQRERAPLGEVVVVTASRSEQTLGESTALVSVVLEEDLNSSPNLALDQQLRQIPGFSLFRRSSSLASHPTTQGVSLRGIGPSGTSRSLVLFDGLPLNDPFGGWVYWNRIPNAVLDRVEVVRGAGSPLYGSSALSGTIQLIPRKAAARRVDLYGLAGSRATWDLGGYAAEAVGDWNYTVAGRVFDTEGFLSVDESIQGAVDVPVFTRFQTLFGQVGYRDFRVGVNAYNEDRGNGTPIQQNRSSLVSLDARIARPAWQANFYTQSGVLESGFSRILPGRDEEVRLPSQRFESSSFGASASADLGHELLLGSDWRYVDWEDHDQNLLGVFLQKIYAVGPRFDLQLGARMDLWENISVQTSFNPRAGLLLRASDWATVRASAYRGFRAPTLNELYRPFRVGNVTTEANPSLEAEKLWGVEGGIDLHPTSGLLLRANVFWNRLEDPVSNVTIGMSGGQILRQRRNVDASRVAGAEVEGNWNLEDAWSLSLSYLYSNTDLSGTGLRIPQVPLNQFSGSIHYSGTFRLTLQGRLVGDSFEDDLNRFVLGRYGLLDCFIGKPVAEAVLLYLSVENLFDQRYVVAATPEERLGEPRTIYGGVRLTFGD